VSDPAIEVRGLRKSYGPREVLHGIDFHVETGEVFALLGPNGAGKTTTVEILEAYRRRDEGEVNVLGEDPEGAGADFRARIGIVLQSSAVYPRLTVRETLSLFAGYYPAPRDVVEVMRLVELEERANVRVRTLSGGQLRRLDPPASIRLRADAPGTPSAGFAHSGRRCC
jgi:ABC-2 type transport system ATP-binding protein